MQVMEKGQHQMGTLGVAFEKHETWENPNAVKAILNDDRIHLFFSSTHASRRKLII